ncbi:unnamed protein product [Brassica oleracea var. botrytis]|uniref:Uncharacterized protein n=2 Tax=Brassica TaxID=3705 RepID=A0A0D3BPC5_BRAOL|nr:unnamed protein product [Brassica napus]CDY71659.1 BnaCnng73830D [Brassica napus]
MEAKSQCKVHYGDEEDADLEESELLLSESSAFPCLNSYCLDLLLGLLREGEGVAARVLENLGVDASNIRTQNLLEVLMDGLALMYYTLGRFMYILVHSTALEMV